jgi:hypothetical protein
MEALKMQRFCQLATWLLTLILSCYVQAGALAVPLRHQEQPNWCWSATSQGVLDYFGAVPRTQCQIASWALTARDGVPRDCCGNPNSNVCNVANFVYSATGSIQDILQHFGTINSTGQLSVLSPATIVTEMNAGRPIVMGWVWTGGGGHALTLKGFVGSDNNGRVHIGDPLGADRVLPYGDVVRAPDHQWTQTLRITGRTMPSVNISVNGMEGPTINVTPSTMLRVDVSLNPNGRSDWADWWLGFELNGILYYFTPAGGVTTTATLWRQAQLSVTNQNVFTSTLPVGNYVLYFAVDLTRNGVLEPVENLYWDSITVQVR